MATVQSRQSNKPAENKHYRYRLINLLLLSIVFSLLCCAFFAHKMLEQPLGKKNGLTVQKQPYEPASGWNFNKEEIRKHKKERANSLIFLSIFAFIPALVLLLRLRKKSAGLQMLRIVGSLAFDSTGIWYNKLFIPWHLVADLYYNDPNDEGAKRSGRGIKVHYLNPQKNRMNILNIIGWTSKYAEMKNLLIYTKEMYAPKNIQCPRCRIDFDATSKDRKIVYSCHSCGRNFIQEAE